MLIDKDRDGIILGADDARLLVFTGPMSILWSARGAHGEKCRPLAISIIDVSLSVLNHFSECFIC